LTAALVLIASYPKSGNTWTRLVLDHVIRRARAPISINDIETGLYVQRRMIFDRFGPVEASDLTVTEIDRYWPEVFRSFAKGQPADVPLVLKTHEAARRTDAGAWLYPPEIVRGVIHLVRHPFDVAASYAHHRGWTIDDTIRALLDPAHRIGGDMDRLQLPMPETAGSWAGHTASWTADDLPWPVTACDTRICARMGSPASPGPPQWPGWRKMPGWSHGRSSSAASTACEPRNARSGSANGRPARRCFSARDGAASAGRTQIRRCCGNWRSARQI
jgi:hypothetical protein